jgi:putative ABC transport system substrate-binding protein
VRRRKFITLLAGAAAAWPMAARAQVPSKRAVIGMLLGGSEESTRRSMVAFHHRMRELGFNEGQNIEVHYRYAEGVLTRLPTLAAELVRLKPDVIVTNFGAGARAAKEATNVIPIVSWILIDPVARGLVASYARPGGNVTGILLTLDTLPSKLLELTIEMIPGTVKIGLLGNPRSPATEVQRKGATAAAAALGVKLVPVEAEARGGLSSAFRTFAEAQVQAVFVLLDPMFFAEKREVASLALTARLPTVYGLRDHVLDGGLLSYGTNAQENAGRAATFVDRILKGAMPADLPVEFPTRLELVINLKTAKALGLTVPPALLARADEVIE